MGMDVSAHPVDVGLIQSRLLPYIRGEGDLSDVLAEVVRVARTRFRANAWGLALTDLQHKEWAAKRERPKKATGVAVGKAKAKPRPQPLLPPWFDYNFHVWGRPFLITTPPESVSDTIDRYMAAKTPKQIDAIAAEQLHQLNPALVGKVKLAKGGTLPPTKRLAQGVGRRPRLLPDRLPAPEGGHAGAAAQRRDGRRRRAFLERLAAARRLVRLQPAAGVDGPRVRVVYRVHRPGEAEAGQAGGIVGELV